MHGETVKLKSSIRFKSSFPVLLVSEVVTTLASINVSMFDNSVSV